MQCFDRLLLWINCFLVLVLLTGRAHSMPADVAPSQAPAEIESSAEDDTGTESSEFNDRVGMSAFFPLSNSGPFSKTHYDMAGKRNPGMYSFGLGKRADQPGRGIYNFGLGKRGATAGSLYNFGLGKRTSPGSLYNFGLGKRHEKKEGWADVKSNNGGQRFNFGLGKRGTLLDEMLDANNNESGEFQSSSEIDEDRPILDKRSAMTDSHNFKSFYSPVYLRSSDKKFGSSYPWEVNNMVGKRPYNFGLGK